MVFLVFYHEENPHLFMLGEILTCQLLILHGNLELSLLGKYINF